MDIGYTYSSQLGIPVSVYAPPAFAPPLSVTLTEGGQPVEFLRVSDQGLDCGRVDGVTGSCGSFECHRRELGKCQCKRHPTVRIARAT